MLYSVAALSTNDAWAVGTYGNANGPALTLIEHWNGSTWSVASSPNPAGSGNSQLLGVTALSPTNAWAVGSYFVTDGARRTLIERWNGKAWSIVPSPNPTTNNTELDSVIAISDTNVWAVGDSTSDAQILQTLVEHWNGSAWSIVPSPNPAGATTSLLSGIAAISDNNIWAVGSASGKRNSSTLIEHWNGSAWSIVNSPDTASSGNVLNALTAISASNIWAVGMTFNEYGSSARTLIEHWNGSTWSIVSSPNPSGSVNNDLLAVTALSASDIWAVGQLDTGHRTYYTLIEHWNGSAWSITSRLDTKSQPNFLQAVTRVPATGNVWAAGYQFNSSNLPTPLIESYC